jgi:hypothetical protein
MNFFEGMAKLIFEGVHTVKMLEIPLSNGNAMIRKAELDLNMAYSNLNPKTTKKLYFKTSGGLVRVFMKASSCCFSFSFKEIPPFTKESVAIAPGTNF